MARLTKAIKTQLRKAAYKKLFGEKVKNLCSDAKDLTEAILAGSRKYVELQQQLLQSSEAFKQAYVDNLRYKCERLEFNGVRLALPRNYSGNVQLSYNGEITNQRYDLPLFSVFHRTAYRVTLEDGIQASADTVEISGITAERYGPAFKALLARSELIKGQMESLDNLIDSMNTDNQLKDLAPDLYKLLPAQTARHAMMVPVESLLLVNELLKAS